MAFAERRPYRSTPIVNRSISLGSSGTSDYFVFGNRTAIVRQRERGPLSLPSCEKHVCSLHFFAGKLLLNVQIQTNQRERQPDAFCILIGILGHEGVNDMLVNEAWITMHERVAAELVVCLLTHRAA
jgi:hypothetical protein